MEPGSEKNRDFSDRDSLIYQIFYLSNHVSGLRCFIGGCINCGFYSAFYSAEQFFCIFFRCVFNDRIGYSENCLAGTVIFLQLDQFHIRKNPWEIHDVTEISPSETVYGLWIIPYDHNVVERVGGKPDNVGLDQVGVLVFIHHDVGKSVWNGLPDLWNLCKKPLPVHEQVVIIHEPVFQLVFFVMF